MRRVERPGALGAAILGSSSTSVCEPRLCAARSRIVACADAASARSNSDRSRRFASAGLGGQAVSSSSGAIADSARSIRASQLDRVDRRADSLEADPSRARLRAVSIATSYESTAPVFDSTRSIVSSTVRAMRAHAAGGSSLRIRKSCPRILTVTVRFSLKTPPPSIAPLELRLELIELRDQLVDALARILTPLIRPRAAASENAKPRIAFPESRAAARTALAQRDGAHTRSRTARSRRSQLSRPEHGSRIADAAHRSRSAMAPPPPCVDVRNRTPHRRSHRKRVVDRSRIRPALRRANRRIANR